MCGGGCDGNAGQALEELPDLADAEIGRPEICMKNRHMQYGEHGQAGAIGLHGAGLPSGAQAPPLDEV
jgi:hypothetical protein